MFSNTFIGPVEKLINRGIDQSDEAGALSRELDGRSMVVRVDMQLLKIPLEFRVVVSSDRLQITDDTDSAADVEVSGTMIELNRLMFAESDLPLRDGRVRIQGDAEIAEKFRTLFLLAQPDLEEELSELAGDELGPRLANTFRAIRRRAIDALEDISEQVSDYLHEDAGQLPSRFEVETFYDAVDELSNDMARIEARLSRIRGNLEETKQAGDTQS